MTKQNHAWINLIVDRSGSMAHLSESTIQGINNFISEQKAVPGTANATLTLFDHEVEIPLNNVSLTDFPVVNNKIYKTRGTTALLDALGTAIDSFGLQLSSLDENKRPSTVIFLVITDGLENASCKYSRSAVAEKIKHQQDVYGWKFVFMGASLDSVKEAQSLGVSSCDMYTASASGTLNSYSRMSSVTKSARS